ncbi:PREDICTED: uncharacterized protein LOC108547765 [Eufriesea mexicana]|uniref:uncharacterized protein LOC108547765 n=1 Tax=Eufriesea mexicana TaxID=516756 RepID=UPI00083C12E3|nr:PREDICTED: uncharacterized protein LOC108547765 [Eufriesea mexicana]
MACALCKGNHLTQAFASMINATLALTFALDRHQNLPLANTNFNLPSEVDALLGAEVSLKLFCVGQIPTPGNAITLQKTKLGWIMAGKLPHVNSQQFTRCHIARYALQRQLTQFLEVKGTPRSPLISVEDREHEAHFKAQTNRDHVSRRYTVRLKFKNNVKDLGECYSVARKRFYALEQKLSQNPELRHRHENILNEYLVLGHTSLVTDSSIKHRYYLPHHAVIMQSRLTTKFRVVFDAPAWTTSGCSLFDAQLVGPNVQEDLLSIVLCFGSHTCVMAADIEKMYLPVWGHPDAREYQNILWCLNVREPIAACTLNTATCGRSAAPFLDTEGLHQLAADEGE